MARGLAGPLLIGAGILGIAGIGYIYLKKENIDLGQYLDPAKWAQWLDDLLGKKPGGGDGNGNGNGNGDGNGGGDGNGNGNEPCVKKTCSSTQEWNQSQCKCVPKTGTGGGTTTGSITLGAAGDWGSGRNSNWQKVADQMIKQKVNVMLGLGDYSYTNTGDWKKVIDRLKKGGILISRIAEGNHDSSSYASTTGQSSMRMAFDAGSARIILLNTESSVSSNVSFAETELKKTNKPWKIFTMHKPLYTNNSDHGAEKSLATALKPIINKYKVQLVMFAHNHNYQRIVKSDQPNTVFICSGTGGESHYDLKASESGTKYMNDSDFGFTKIVITPTTLKGQFITSGGTVKDSWTQGVSSSNYARAYLTEMEPIGMRVSI